MNDKINLNNELVAILNALSMIRKELIEISSKNDLAKLSDFLDEADFDTAKAMRNVKQAIKLAGKKR